MGWINPKTDWAAGDGVKASDLNRIEGNTEELLRRRQLITGHADSTSPGGTIDGHAYPYFAGNIIYRMVIIPASAKLLLLSFRVLGGINSLLSLEVREYTTGGRVEHVTRPMGNIDITDGYFSQDFNVTTNQKVLFTNSKNVQTSVLIDVDGYMGSDATTTVELAVMTTDA